MNGTFSVEATNVTVFEKTKHYIDILQLFVHKKIKIKTNSKSLSD